MEISKRLTCCSNIRPRRTKLVRWQKYFHNHCNCLIYACLAFLCLCFIDIILGFFVCKYILHTSKQDGVTPLWIASEFGHVDAMRSLIRHKATVDKVDKVTAQVISFPPPPTVAQPPSNVTVAVNAGAHFLLLMLTHLECAKKKLN